LARQPRLGHAGVLQAAPAASGVVPGLGLAQDPLMSLLCKALPTCLAHMHATHGLVAAAAVFRHDAAQRCGANVHREKQGGQAAAAALHPWLAALATQQDGSDADAELAGCKCTVIVCAGRVWACVHNRVRVWMV
jgi:hypothetical protein